MVEHILAQKRSITGRFFASKGTRTDCGGSADIRDYIFSLILKIIMILFYQNG